MASRTATNTASRLAASSLFDRLADGFAGHDFSNNASINAGLQLPNPNDTRAIDSDNGDRLAAGSANATDQQRSSNGLCNFHDTEYAIRQRYRYNSNCHKNLKTLQQTIAEKKRPCLFDAAKIFGGTECTEEVFNGICSFHWSMLNLRVGVCEQYNTHTKCDGTFQHYEMLVDVAISDRALVPIFPNINDRTSIWDLMFGFTYATNRGLLTTKINEGAAMAYALYYMINNHCYVEFLARATYWVQNMTEYLMAYVFYNDELLKDVYASKFPVEQDNTNPDDHRRSVLKNIFTKNIYVQDVNFDVEFPRIQLPDGIESMLNEKDAHLVRNLPPLSNVSDGGSNLQSVSGGRNDHRIMKYKQFHIFVAPLILSLRPSSYVTDLFLYSAPPVIGVFNINFKDGPEATAGSRAHGGHSVFAIQGPVQYGVAVTRGNRNLPFAADMPNCTQAYVATLGGVSNLDISEDRIFASELARFADFTIPESDRLFSLNALN